MRSVIQRVYRAAVKVDHVLVGEIGPGLLALIGIGKEDGPSDLEWLADKIIGLRIFEDENGKMNLSLADVGGELLLVSQFTLYADCRKGKRPGFSEAARPEEAEKYFNDLVRTIRGRGIRVETGRFQTEMDVELVNHGPVTIILDSKKNN